MNNVIISKVIIDTNDNSNLINEIRNLNLSVPLYDEDYEKVLKIMEKNNKVKKFGYVFWCNIKEEINKQKKDLSITSVYFEYIDRGVGHWSELDSLLREKYPNIKSIIVAQNFGKDNLSSSFCDIIIMNTMSSYYCNKENIVFFKEFSEPEDEYVSPDKTYLFVVKLHNQYQVIISDEEPNNF